MGLQTIWGCPIGKHRSHNETDLTMSNNFSHQEDYHRDVSSVSPIIIANQTNMYPQVPSNTEVSTAPASATITITEEQPLQTDEVLQLTLHARPNVRWDESVVDNEGMGRKSSKRCCIFHKQRSFGESSTDSSDNEYDSDKSGSSTASGGAGGNGDKKPRAVKKNRKIARPKSGKVPDYQRFHA